jgi:hypothetical protein
MLENFSRSLQSIFDLYKEKRNSYFEFSFSFAVFSVLASIFITTIVCLLAKEIFEWEGSDKPINEDVIAMTKCYKLMSYYFVLSFGVYAIYLKNLLNKNSIVEKPTLRGMYANLTSQNKLTILSVVIAISIVYIIFFKSLFGNQEGNLGMINDIELGNSMTKRFLLWLNSIVELLKQYLPYFGAFYIFLSNYDKSFSFKDILKYKRPILTFILLSFCIVSISGHLKSYIDVYIVNFIFIVFKIEIVQVIIQSFIYIFISSFFYLGLAASIMYPVVNQDIILEKQ